MDEPRVFDTIAAAGGICCLVVAGSIAAGSIRPAGTATVTLAIALAVLVVVPLTATLADLPFRDGTRSRWYRAAAVLTMPAGIAAVVSLALPSGVLAGAFALPWLVLTGLLAIFGAQRGLPNTHAPSELAVSVGLLYLPVAGIALLLHRIDVTVGFTATTMLLTVVHFHYAGCALPVFAGLVGRAVDADRGDRTYRALLAPVLVGPGIIGLGIAFSPAVELFAAGFFAIVVGGFALYTLATVVVFGGIGRTLIGFAAASVATSMVFVVAYLLTPWIPRTLVTFEAMLVGHGWLNAVGFALVGLAGWRLVDPRPRVSPLGMPLSRLTSRGRVGPDYVERNAIRGDGDVTGMVDEFSTFDGPAFESTRVHLSVRRFYERTVDYDLHVESSWSRGFRTGARLYAAISRFVEQMNFPTGVHDSGTLSSRLVPVDDAADGRADVRSWIRTYDETGAAIYVALYSAHSLDGTPYMNIAFPLPGTNLTSVLSVDPLGLADPDGVELSTTTGGDAGIYLRTPLGPLRIPMNETIRVWSAEMEPAPGDEADDGEAELHADHEIFLFGRRFLRLEYRLSQRSDRSHTRYCHEISHDEKGYQR